MKSEVKTIHIEEISNRACMKYNVYRIDNKDDFISLIECRDNPFMINDILGVCVEAGFIPDKIIEIFYIYVYPEYRGNKFATNLWESFLQEENVYNSKSIVLIKAAPLTFDYPEEPEKEIYDKELIKQSVYIVTYMKMMQINSLCGFETSIPYILPTDKIKPVIEVILKDEITMPKNRLGANLIK